jgi:hypothetical protein
MSIEDGADEFAGELAETTAVTSPDDDGSGEDELTPRRTRRRRSDAGVKRGTGAPRGRRASSARVSNNLLQFWGIMAAALAPRSPTGAAVLMERGEITCAALVEIAQRHPKMLKALEAMGNVGPVAVVAQTAMEATLAVAMDLGKLPPEHPMAAGLGLTETYLKMHPDYGRYIPENNTEGPQQTAPPAGFIPASDPRHPMYSFSAGSRFAGNPYGVSA